MKPYLYLTFLLLSMSYGSLAQAPGTTEEEYNYMTKGYRVQIESGLDMKKGYKMEDFGSEIIYGNYKFQLKVLEREATEELAGVLVITKSNVSGKTYYTCIPVKNKDLFQRYWSDMGSWDESITKAYCYVLSAYFSSSLEALVEEEKKQKK